MIVNAGEISFVEYGNDKIVGWIRTELVNPHLISVRVNERKRKIQNIQENVSKVAYLLDIHTISIGWFIFFKTTFLVNLNNNTQIAQISHNSSIDWIEVRNFKIF